MVCSAVCLKDHLRFLTAAPRQHHATATMQFPPYSFSTPPLSTPCPPPTTAACPPPLRGQVRQKRDFLF